MGRPRKYKGLVPPKDLLGLTSMSSEDTLKFIIGVDAPGWKTVDILAGKKDDVKVTHMFLEYVGEPPCCPQCGQPMKRHDCKERMWRHANLDNTVCFIHAETERFKCRHCNLTKQVDTPWADPNVSYSHRFSEVAIQLMREMSLNAVSRIMMCTWSVLDGIVEVTVNEYLDALDLSMVRRIRVDETSAKKRHRYITVFTDADTDQIIFITKGKDGDTVREFSDWLVAHGGDPSNIEVVSSDLSQAFISGVERYLPKAENVFDPFHVIQLGNKALDKDRTANQTNGQKRKDVRYALFRNPVNFKENDEKLIEEYLRDNKSLGVSYGLNMGLREALSQLHWTLVGRSLWAWIKEAKRTGSTNFKRLAKTVKEHLAGIINAKRFGINNGFQEGLNGRVQLAKAIGKGYRKESRLGRIVYFRESQKYAQ